MTTNAFPCPCNLSLTCDEDLPMSRDQKVMTVLPLMEMCPMDFYQGVIFTAEI